jgi:hypothetical protein
VWSWGGRLRGGDGVQNTEYGLRSAEFGSLGWQVASGDLRLITMIWFLLPVVD